MGEHVGRNRGGLDAAKRNVERQGRNAPGFDFNNMNFEQRREPYNSGTRTVAVTEYKALDNLDAPASAHGPRQEL